MVIRKCQQECYQRKHPYVGELTLSRGIIIVTMQSLVHCTSTRQRGNMSFRISINSESFASLLPETHEEVSSGLHI